MRPAAKGALEGWPLVGWAAAVVAAVSAAGLAWAGTGEDGVRLGLRLTARTSLAFFLAAYAASALRRTWPGPATRWLLRNRRQAGVSFAVSHTFHLGFLLWLAALPDGFAPGEPDPVTLVGGGFGFVVLYAMAATSNDRAVAWLGPRRWGRLHRFGIHILWIVFFATYAPRPFAGEPGYAVFALLLLAALGLRLHAGRARRAAPSPAA